MRQEKGPLLDFGTDVVCHLDSQRNRGWCESHYFIPIFRWASPRLIFGVPYNQAFTLPGPYTSVHKLYSFRDDRMFANRSRFPHLNDWKWNESVPMFLCVQLKINLLTVARLATSAAFLTPLFLRIVEALDSTQLNYAARSKTQTCLTIISFFLEQ